VLSVVLTLTAVAVLVPALPASATTSTSTSTKALVVYDTTGQWGFLGEVYATQVANLAGHFGGYDAVPASHYTSGQVGAHAATIYVGSTYDEPLPSAFLQDVLATTKPVIWVNYNIWKLEAASPTWLQDRGWQSGSIDTSTVTEVRYKGVSLTRNTLNAGGIVGTQSLDSASVTVLAQAVRDDGTTFPWAVRTGNFTYIGEIPFAYESENDRYMAFSDLLFDALAPQTPERHRALVRLEDVNPTDNPNVLRQLADYFSSENVPFSVGVIPYYVDPNGYYNNGVPEKIHLKDAPDVVAALKYMQSKGGTIIMHGYTHQYSNVANPYSGVTADDFEFYLSHVDANNNVQLDGPVPEDSTTWATNRITAGFKEFKGAGLAQPTIFEFPHYAGSVTDYKAIAAKFKVRYERALYPAGALSGSTPNYQQPNGQFFPYPVRDIYGSKVVPEDVGNYEPVSYNNHPTRFATDMVATAHRDLAVRDGFASFFFHPYLLEQADSTAVATAWQNLQDTITGIKGAGYSFVAAGSV